MAIHRIIVVPEQKRPSIFKIINLEIKGPAPDLSVLYPVFANPVTMQIVDRMPERTPKRPFREVMYKNAVIDPEQATIIALCRDKGIKVQAAKVGYRYYGKRMRNLYINKLVHVAFDEEPVINTLRPRGVRQPMQYYNLRAMSDEELKKLSADRELHLSRAKMKKLASFQKRLRVRNVTDVFLETFAASWSDHCFHDLWKSLGLFRMLKYALKVIKNPNVISAFVDNAGVWDFYDGFCILFKLETHNSPSKSEPFGGQMTKLGGVIRDILMNGLGAKPVGNIEFSVFGELERRRYPGLFGKTWPEATLARETIRAISGYGNPMGIPMMLARMMFHPAFSGKPFALGGTVGLTNRRAAQKGMPRRGDLALLVGGRTGNDGLHGATVSSSGITDKTDDGDYTHVQIGLPFIERQMMAAIVELRDADCCSMVNDFGAAGIVSAFGEMGKDTDDVGGIFINLALVPLKCAGLANWQIALSESQERFALAVKPEKLRTAKKILRKYGLEATVIGIFTGTKRFQMIYDRNCKKFHSEMSLTGEICLDVPYHFIDECPLVKTEVEKPAPKKNDIKYPMINRDNVAEMGLRIVGHPDVCDQSWATTQYDSTVQGIRYQGPLCGRRYNIGSSLAVSKPVYGKPYGLTISSSFSPWQFEVDPVIAAENAMMDALVTQVIAGVAPTDITLSDNFYTDGDDPVARWYLKEQVKVLTQLSIRTRTPFTSGKDSSSGRGKFGDTIVSVPSSVCITAMGKVPNANSLLLHQWTKPGNILVSIGRRTERLDGSILSSSLGITGTKLDDLVSNPAHYLDTLYQISKSGMIISVVPVNRGGLFLRLFEGVEASGFGVSTDLCRQLFTESFGSVLVEVKREAIPEFFRTFSEVNPLVVGTILPRRGITVQNRRLDFKVLRTVWGRSFKEALKKGTEEVKS